MSIQEVRGNQNVLIKNVRGSSIQITIDGQTREVPLEPAVVPVGARAKSPARLIRARSGVVPYAARKGLLAELEDWVGVTDPFAGYVIGGRGGSGKTRLAVELCERVRASGWLCGLLARIADPAALEALVGAPTARLVVVDYAESRLEQLEILLPLLAAGATTEHPVRVLLLVRASPRRTADWTEALRNRNDGLDAVLDECEVRALEDVPLEIGDRVELFSAAAGAFAARTDPPAPSPDPPQALGDAMFGSPLLVVLASYLAVHGDAAVPSTKAALLDEVLAHEQRYWRASANGLFLDDVLPRRVIGLTTLSGAENEDDAADLLCLLPDLADATAERRGSMARWAHELYPGPRWWNPLEPDLVGEHLVADTFTDQPVVLAGVLAREDPERLIQPLEVYARAAADHEHLADALQPILSRELARLCRVAVEQAEAATDLDLIYGNITTTAAAIDHVVTIVKIEASAVSDAIASIPSPPGLILNALAITLSAERVRHLRPLAGMDPTGHEPDLARSLNRLSDRLGDAGRIEEGLVAIEEAVAIRRRLADADPAVHEFDVASSLNSLSLRLSEAGRPKEGLAAIEEAVAVCRRLAAADPDTLKPYLAQALNNLAVDLGEAGRPEEALTAIEEAVAIRRQLATARPAAYEPDLAQSLNNLSVDLGRAGRPKEGLAAIEEAVAIYRRLASANPAAHEPDLAQALNNLAVDLGRASRRAEGLAAIKEAVAIYRRLAAAHPAAYEPDLAQALNNLSADLGRYGPSKESLAGIEEAVAIRRRLADASPVVYEPDLAQSLNNLAVDFARAGLAPEGLAAIEEAVAIYRRQAAANPVVYEPQLAQSLSNLSGGLREAGRHDEGLAAIEEAVVIFRRFAAANPVVYEAQLARALGDLSDCLSSVGRYAEGQSARQELSGLSIHGPAQSPP